MTGSPPHDAEWGPSAVSWRRRLLRLARDHRAQALLLFLAVSWPVKFGGSTDIASVPYAGALSSDFSSFVWYFWHLKEALLGHRELLFSDQLFYPLGLHLIRQDWAPVPGLLALPFQLLGPIAAVNGELFLAFVLCGFFTYLLAHHLCRHRGYALLAGFVFAYCDFRISKAAGHVSQANQQFLPLYLYWLVRFAEQGRARFAAWAGVSVALATFCSPYQLVYAVLLTPCFYGYRLAAAAAGRRGRELVAMIRFGVIAGAVAALLASPLVISQWEVLWRGEAGYEQVAQARARPFFSLDLLSLVASAFRLPGKGLLSAEGGLGFMGYSTLLLFVASLVLLPRRFGAGVWAFTALVFLWLSMGGWLVAGGQVLGPLPVTGLLQSLPVLRGATVPSRYVSVTVLCVGLCIAVTGAAWERRRPGAQRAVRWAAAGLIVIPCVELCLPYGIQLMAWGRDRHPRGLPPIPLEVVAGGRDQTILYVPPVWETNRRSIGPSLFPRSRFVALTRHQGSVPDGMGDAIPAGTLEYFERLPLLRDLVLLGRASSLPRARPIRRSAPADARYVARRLGIRYVVADLGLPGLFLRPQAPRLDPHAVERAVEYLGSVLRLEEVARTPDAVYWRVAEAPDEAPRSITFRREGSWVHLGPGWQRSVSPSGWWARLPWRGGRPGVLLLPSPSGAGELTLLARCRPRPCTVSLRANGKALGKARVASSWRNLRFPLPRLGSGGQLFRLEQRPELQDGPPGFPVGQTETRSPVPIEVSSFGLMAGDDSSVTVDGMERGLRRRGHNLVVIDPQTGQVRESRSFDLVDDLSGTAGARLVAFIRRIPAGQIVCDSVRDDGSLNVTDQVVAALRSIGARGRLRYRHSYAVVGVKGARPGTAVERVSRRPVHIRLDQALELQSVRIEPASGT